MSNYAYQLPDGTYEGPLHFGKVFPPYRDGPGGDYVMECGKLLPSIRVNEQGEWEAALYRNVPFPQSLSLPECEECWRDH